MNIYQLVELVKYILVNKQVGIFTHLYSRVWSIESILV